MEHRNSSDNDAANRENDSDAAHRDNPETATDPAEARPSAIERQMAAAPEFAYRDSPRRTLTDHTADRYIDDYAPVRRRRRRRFGLTRIVLLLLLLIAAGLSLLFVKLDNPLLQAIATNSSSTGEVARDDSSTAANSPSVAESSPAINPPADSSPESITPASSDISQNSTDSQPASADNSQSQAPQSKPQTPPSTEQQNSNGAQEVSANTKTASAPDVISIPTSDISLRDRPELLEQLVPIYRAQLASDPNNSTARNALAQLQERSLSELQAIVLAGDDATAVKLLEMVARLFPEAADSARYKYLAARMDRVHRQKSDAAGREQAPSSAANATSTASSAPSAALSASSAAAATAATNSSASTKKSAEQKAAAASAKTSENSGPIKPEITSVVMTPGTMVDNRFVPTSGGNVFMVELSYRNFNRAFVGEAQATLVTRIGAPGESLVLAEAPVVITADRGTKNFLIETPSVQGYIGGKLQLNFILNDEFLASRTVRLSLPER